MELFVIALLIILGTVLLVAEIALIPGLGFTGIAGVGAMIASAVYAFMQLGEIAGWITIAIVIFVAIALILWAIYGKSLDNVALKENIVSTVADAGASNIKVSDRGVTVTRLALIGEVKFGDEIIEVTSADGFIDEKCQVVVTRIASGVIYVEKFIK
ncbi:MAG: nodulation efficiency protein D (NfeD) [Bacteroidaceae bacterium]|nr:nodulation efficiency protein D (NfeD) [Bacteroidaceae bacterium]